MWLKNFEFKSDEIYLEKVIHFAYKKKLIFFHGILVSILRWLRGLAKCYDKNLSMLKKNVKVWSILNYSEEF